MSQCTGKTAAGKRCERKAKKDTKRCAQHTAGATQKGGRPSKIEDVADQIIDLVRAGNYRVTAALAAGISEDTLHDWLARGEEHTNGHEPPASEAPYVWFLRSLKEAEAVAETELLKDAASGRQGWQAPMTVLERKFPDRWGRSEKRFHEHGGQVAHEHKLDLSKLTEDELRDLRKLTAKAALHS